MSNKKNDEPRLFREQQMSAVSSDQFIRLTAEIVSAYVLHNNLPSKEVGALIASTYQALSRLEPPAAPMVEPQQPAVAIKKSLTSNYLVCLEDGRKFKSLKRHLRTSYGMSPDDYREKWGLAPDYPMVAPAYSAKRSQLARLSGLGRKP